MIKLVVENVNEKLRLDNFLLNSNPSFSRSHYKNLIENNLVFVNGKTVKKAGYVLKENDIVEFEPPKPIPIKAEAENIKLDIVYEDNDLAVINKPKGMVVHPACGNWKGTLVNALLFNIKNLSGINGVIRPGIVHRLDKDTSGLIVVAKNDFSHVSLSKQIANKTCHRIYLALLSGNLKSDEGVIKNYLTRDPKNRLRYVVSSGTEGKYAETHYKVINRYKNYTLVKFELKTGRTHQIRVHAKHLQHPIVGDTLYSNIVCKFKIDGQLLHAYILEFVHPVTNETLTFTADLPNDFKKVLEILEKNKCN